MNLKVIEFEEVKWCLHGMGEGKRMATGSSAFECAVHAPGHSLTNCILFHLTTDQNQSQDLNSLGESASCRQRDQRSSCESFHTTAPTPARNPSTTLLSPLVLLPAQGQQLSKQSPKEP